MRDNNINTKYEIKINTKYRITKVSGVCVRYKCDIILLIIDISYLINLKGYIIELLHPTLEMYISNRKVRLIMRDLRRSWHRMKHIQILLFLY